MLCLVTYHPHPVPWDNDLFWRIPSLRLLEDPRLSEWVHWAWGCPTMDPTCRQPWDSLLWEVLALERHLDSLSEVLALVNPLDSHLSEGLLASHHLEAQDLDNLSDNHHLDSLLASRHSGSLLANRHLACHLATMAPLLPLPVLTVASLLMVTLLMAHHRPHLPTLAAISVATIVTIILALNLTMAIVIVSVIGIDLVGITIENGVDIVCVKV